MINLTNFDIIRDYRHDECVNKWLQNKGVGSIDACPGFGKTNIGMKVINKRLDKYPNSYILILVPSDITKKVWIEKQPKNTTILSITEATNRISELYINTYDILIVDELHKFSTSNYFNILSTLAEVSKFRLGLTGSYPYKDVRFSRLFPVVDTVTEKEAIEKNWISDFIEYNISVELGESEKTNYTNYSEFISETMNLFKGKAKVINQNTNLFDDDLDLIYSCYLGKRTKLSGIKYIEGRIIRESVAKIHGWSKDLPLINKVNRNIDNYWRPENIYERCKVFKNLITLRNDLLINNDQKLYLVLEILKTFDKPTIIYNGSTEFANRLADKLGAKAILYHSKIKSRPVVDKQGNIVRFSTGKVKMYGKERLKKEAIEGIKSGKYKYLVTVDSLDEGLNLPELEQTIITSGSTNPLKQIQRTGRSKRYNFDLVSKKSRIFNIYVDDFTDNLGNTITSRDKSKLIVRQDNYTHSVKWINNLKEITL